MNAIRWVFLLSAAGLVACGEAAPSPSEPSPSLVDGDGDGLSDADEATLGLDPLDADSDDDRLADGLEAAEGCDPLVADTDGDLYLDGDEVARGVDPTDASSWIYIGGWPFNGDKGAIPDPGFYGAAAVGERFPDIRGYDQHGELVHLYDFADRGRPVMLDFSTEWCDPCNELADYLATGEPDFGFPNLRAAVEEGEVYWITVLLEDRVGEDPTPLTTAAWEELHPSGRVPALAPLNPSTSYSFVYPEFGIFPLMAWLDPDMTIRSYDSIFTYTPCAEHEAELRAAQGG